MQFGACDYLLHGDETQKFDEAKQLGLSGVEIFVTREQLRDPAQSRLLAIKQAAKLSGLSVPSMALGHLNAGGWSSSDKSVQDAATHDVQIAIAWAKELGIPTILLPFFFDADAPDPAGFDRLVTHFRELCPVAARDGISLTYEGQFQAKRIIELAEHINQPNFGCYFDLANVVWLGMDTPSEIRELGSLIKQVHMKESKVGPGDARPGQGRVKYADSAIALKEIGYDAWLVLETPAGPFEQVAEDLAFTKRHFAQISQ